ncbi:hypothetical protein ANO14919_066700 [Xylariales sp. No.14919]|nr:hypothetical protein ANO14919_066700 [Xylariales sp. No.14919]
MFYVPTNSPVPNSFTPTKDPGEVGKSAAAFIHIFGARSASQISHIAFDAITKPSSSR